MDGMISIGYIEKFILNNHILNGLSKYNFIKTIRLQVEIHHQIESIIRIYSDDKMKKFYRTKSIILRIVKSNNIFDANKKKLRFIIIIIYY